MKLSRYTLFVDDYPETGKSLAYNTRTQGLVVLNSAIRSLLGELPVALNSIHEEARPILAKLNEMGFTVKDDADELDLVRDWFQTIRYSSRKLEAYIFTTFFCNFACPYCFEGKEKEKRYLKKETAEKIILWLKNKAMEVNPEKVEIVFFGGEPLLNIPMIEFISQQLHDYFRETPWKFEFSIITNGALVSLPLVERLNAWGMKSIRITIDGDKEYHDQYRPFLSGKGTFDLIVRNIKAVADKTKIVLAGNFNSKNYDSLYTLLDYFEAQGLKEKIALIDFKPITETRDQVSSNAITAPSYSCDPGHAQKMIDIKKELIRRGFKTSKALDGSGICHFKAADHEVVIDTDGLLYKCPAMVGQANKAVGTVDSTTLGDRYKDFMSFDLVEWKGKCESCNYLPFCAGGCNYHAELKTGSHTNVFCEKEFFDQTIDDFIKIKYIQLITKKAAAVPAPAAAPPVVA